MQENPRNIDIIVDTILISSVILCIIGIDNMTTKIFTDSLEKLGLPRVVNLEGRMFSSLGYVNSFAIILAIAIILALNQIVQDKRGKYKCTYSGVIFLNLSCFILTYSRAVFILFLFSMIAYTLVKGNKSKFLKILYILIMNGILSLCYMKMWNNFTNKEAYLALWFATIIIAIISMIFEKMMDKIEKQLEKITIKACISICIIIIILVIIAIGGDTKLTIPLSIFSANTSRKTVKFNIDHIKPDTEYSFQFDIEASSRWKRNENYTIKISEENKYCDEVESHEISFNNCKENKEIKFITSKETIAVAILLQSKSKSAQLGLTVNSLTINGEEYPLKYLYLPTNLVNKIKSINLNNKSVSERATFYYDAMKIIKANLLFGIGGNGWKYEYIKVQSYRYDAIEVHSYLLQVLIDNGLIGFLACITTFILVLKKWIKDKNNIAIGIVLILLITHSLMDFDMSFYYIMMVAFVLLGILASEEREDCYKRNNIMLLIISNILCLLAILLGVIYIQYTDRINVMNDKIINLSRESNYHEAIELMKQYRKTEKSKVYYNELESMDYHLVEEENLKDIYEILEEMPISVTVEYNRKKNKIIEKILTSCEKEEMKGKFAQMIIEQHEEMLKRIQDKEKNRLTATEIKTYTTEQNAIYELAKEIY